MFFDRDGTLNAHVVRDDRRSSPWRVDEFTLVPDAVVAAAALRAAGARLFVVTNQPDVHRGLLDPCDLDSMHRQLREILVLDHVYVCPHVAALRCGCRKPAGALFRRAVEEFEIDLSRSWMFGDRATDAQAALSAGLRAVVITPVQRAAESTAPDLFYATSLTSGVREVLRARDDRHTIRSTE
ncbi:HAD-IIIA family hydrolase [Brachybacterium sp. GPGPB12]|uniref:HAD-IIIA family hydrolase n=1 Tax=Brachybacterium sp. GPGPB12 TaxID=3023517 RepID=UPI0031342CA4